MTITTSYCLLSSPTENLSKTFEPQPDGSIARINGGQISKGTIQRIDRTAADVPSWMRAFAPDIETLTHNQALMSGVAINGIAVQGLTTLKKPRGGAIARTKANFAFTAPGLVCLDGDNPACVDLLADVLVIEPAFGNVAVGRRLSVSASIVKLDGVPLSESEHLFVLVTRPDLMKEYADLAVELSFLKGLGWFKVGSDGRKHAKGVFDHLVFSPERVLYEGAGIARGGLTLRSRPLTLAGSGTGLFDVEAAITRAQTLLSDPANAAIVAANKRKALDAVALEMATKRQAWLEKHKDRLKALGVSRQRIKNDLRVKRAAFRLMDTVTEEHDGESYARGLLTSLDEVLMDDGSVLNLGAFMALPIDEQRAYEYRHCADPYEPDYHGSRSVATFLWSERHERMMIFSHAHGGIIYLMQRTENFDGDESFDPELPWVYFDWVSVLNDKPFIHIPTKVVYFERAKLNNHLPRTPGFTPGGKETMIGATVILDQRYVVHGRTWWPGKPAFLIGMATDGGSVFAHPGSVLLNLYVPPPAFPGGDAAEAEPWLQLIYDIFGIEQGNALLDWMAFVVQNPGVKINYALVLTGKQGIGKNTILKPLSFFLGYHNVTEDVSIDDATTDFNKFVRQRLFITINEAAKADGDGAWLSANKVKVLFAAPPDFLTVKEKWERAYPVPNVVNVAITTNFGRDGVYLEGDAERRYLMLGSKVTVDDLGGAAERVVPTAKWLSEGGWRHCIQFLLDRDLSRFSPNDPPIKTKLFHDAVKASRSSFDMAVMDAVENWRLNCPSEIVFTVDDLRIYGEDDFRKLMDAQQKVARRLPIVLDDLGFQVVPNPNSTEGKWSVPINSDTMMAQAKKMRKGVVIYGDQRHLEADLVAAAAMYVGEKWRGRGKSKA